MLPVVIESAIYDVASVDDGIVARIDVPKTIHGQGSPKCKYAIMGKVIRTLVDDEPSALKIFGPKSDDGPKYVVDFLSKN